jgi:co-chaperonin GroES (HSP10)
MTLFKPHARGILVEYCPEDTTKSGIIIPEGVEKGDLSEYRGDIIVATGKNVDTDYQPGDTVLFNHMRPPVQFFWTDAVGHKHCYHMWNETDIICKLN